MEIKFPCPNCSLHISVDETAVGQVFPCPSCNTEVQVPSPKETQIRENPATPAPPPAASSPPPFRGTPEEQSAAAAPPPFQDQTQAAPQEPPLEPSSSGPPPFQGISEENAPPPPDLPLKEAAEQPGHAPQVENSAHGFSAGFLAGILDRRLIWLKSRTIGGAFDATAKKLKTAGDIALLVIIAVWMGMSIYRDATGAEDPADSESNDPTMADKGGGAKMPDKAGDTAARAEAAALFAKQVEPVFKARCYKCHGPDKQSSKLNLAMRGNMGDVNGLLSVVNTDMPDMSNLLVRVKDADDPMPPESEGDMLKADEVDAIAKWVTAGAPDPLEASAAGAGGTMVSSQTLVAIGKAVLLGTLAVFIVLVVHYLTGRFFDANESIIAASTPSRISTATVPNALAVLFWIASVALLAAAIIQSGTLALENIKANWLAALFNLAVGGLLFALCLALARLFVADDFLNIKASHEANSGDEALGVFSLFIKVGLKMAPVFYGLCLALGAGIFSINQLNQFETFQSFTVPPPESLLFGRQLTGLVMGEGISLASLGMDVSLPEVVVLPVKAYFYFLAAFLTVEVARAVLNISRRLGAK